VSFNIASTSGAVAPQRVTGIASSSTFLSILGVKPFLGRYFLAGEDKPTSPYVAALSYGFWQRHFGGSPKVIGQQVRLDGNNYTVVGVLPQQFVFPGSTADVFVSFTRALEPQNRLSHSNHFFQVIGRLAPGSSVAAAQEDASAITRNFRRDHPTEIMGRAATVMEFNRYLVRDVKTSLLVLLGSVGCLLLIACVNIANLLLTRALSRQRELAIRAAVGASRAQIIRQLLIESTTLSLLGAIAGLLVASWTTSLLITHAPGAQQLPQIANIRIDRAVLLFTTGLALFTGFAAGLFPALAASRADVVNSLKANGRSSTSGRSQGGLRDLLVATEVALSLVLLIGAGLLLRSFLQIQNVRPGFRADHAVSFALSLPEASYKNREMVSNFAQRLCERLRSVPGVQSAGLTSYPPLAGHWNDSVFRIKGHPLPPTEMMDLITRSTDPDYLRAIGIPLIKGRFLTARDGSGYDDKHPRLGQVLISQSTAHKFFSNFDPLGQTLIPGTDAGAPPNPEGNPYPEYQIVGVVGDVPTSVEEGIQPTLYNTLYDGRSRDFYAVVHSASDPLALVTRLRAQVHELDPNIPIHHVRTLEQINTAVTGDRRFSVTLLVLFAALAQLLAAIGLYGVVSYAVTQRTSEIGIRMALGASRRNVSRLILFDGLKPALAGIVAGLVASIAVSHILKSMLFGVSSIDPVTFAAVTLILSFVVAFACLIPALRATRIGPTVALRTE
jgi:putative ABC transport system permease protein